MISSSNWLFTDFVILPLAMFSPKLEKSGLSATALRMNSTSSALALPRFNIDCAADLAEIRETSSSETPNVSCNLASL